MNAVRKSRPSAEGTLRTLAVACILLALMCVALAVAWRAKSDEAACFRDALADGETPAIAETDCL